MINRLRTGIVGCAGIAERMMIPAIKASKDLEIVAVASRSKEKAINFAEKFDCEYETGYEALLSRKDIEVIYMPLPTGLHLEWGIKALNSGKHLLLEKSLALNFVDAQKIVHTASKNNLLVQENFMFEHHSQFRFILDALRNNKLGDIRCIRSAFGFPPFQDLDNIRYQKLLGGGALLDSGAYTVKLAQLLLGYDLSIDAACLSYDFEKEVDIHGGIFMHDALGTIVETAFGFDHFYQCNLEIWGNKGKLTAERIFTAGPGVKPVIRMESNNETEVIEMEADNHFVNLLNDFSKTIIQKNFVVKYDNILNQARLLQSVSDIARKIILT